MTGEELTDAGKELYGKRWKAPLARALRVEPVTIWRYVTSGVVPGPVAVAIGLMLEKERRRRKRRSRSSADRAAAS